jgi:mRNA interferase RelE/StbE
MAEYKIFFKRSAVKDLGTISKKDRQRIIDRIDLLKEEPRPPGCEKLSGQERYRVRQDNFHIGYSIQDERLSVWIIKIGQRRNIYR